MQKIIKVPSQIDVTDVQPFIRVSLDHPIESYSDEQREAINEYLSHITELGFSYKSNNIIIVKKQDCNLLVDISETF